MIHLDMQTILFSYVLSNAIYAAVMTSLWLLEWQLFVKTAAPLFSSATRVWAQHEVRKQAFRGVPAPAPGRGF